MNWIGFYFIWKSKRKKNSKLDGVKLKELSASNLSANYLQLAIHSDTQSRLEKHLCPWDKNLFSKRAKRKYHGSTATMPPRGCHLNKNLPFVLSNFEPCFLV